jgi:alpha-ketoglutarate-dependent taurine dioxygenase
MFHQIPSASVSDFSAAKSALDETGACVLSGLKNSDEFLEFSRSLGSIYKHRDSTDDGITPVIYDPDHHEQSGFAGFSQDSFEYHTDRSTLETPPALMLLYSGKPSEQGGYSRFVDAKKLCERIACTDDSLMQFIRSKNRIIYDDSIERYRGSILYDVPGQRFGFRFRCDANGFYSHSDFTNVQKIIHHARQLEHTFLLPKGTAIAVNNERWLHGRTSFLGERAVLRILLNPSAWFRRGFDLGTGSS